MLYHTNENKLKCYLSRYSHQNIAYFANLEILQKGGGVSVAHIADDIQKQSKTIYLNFFYFGC
jgi:hypothetical protein